MTAILHIQLFGGLRVALDGVPIHNFYSIKAPALLAYLIVTRRAPTRDALAALLWGEMSDTDAKTNLRQCLANLRKLLDPYLCITRDTVEFNFDAPHLLDVEQFQNHLRADELEAAVALYLGDFLDGVFVRDAPTFDEWAIAQRARWRELALQTLHTLTQHHSARGEYARGIDCATRLIALDPWREETHRELMLMLARSGQRSVALQQYQVCQRILAEEMNVAPAAETTALYERIRAAGETIPHNLPPPQSSFVGRAKELTQIETLLLKRDCRLITLVGAGGIGKTRLALAAAARALNLGAFLNGVFFVALGDVTQPELLAPAIAEACGLKLTGKQSPQTQLINFLCDKESLIVLDNFEALFDAAALLCEWLDHAPHLKLLVTSRERLNLRAEWLVALDGLDFPDAQHVSEASRFSSVALFVERARQLRDDFDLNAATQPAIARICQIVEGMPLGIELASAWIQTHTCDEIAREIERGYAFLATVARDVPERQRSLRAVFDHSLHRLPAREHETFQRLAVFRGGFSLAAAEQIANASREVLAGLMNKSFLRRHANGRYEMHELLRQYAAEKLIQSGADESTRIAHVKYFAAFLNDCAPELDGNRQVDALARITADIGNVHAAWQFALDRRDLTNLQRACQGVFAYYMMRGDYHTGRVLFETAQRALPLTNSSDPALSLFAARTLIRLGQFSHRLGLLDEAETILTQGLGALPADANELAPENSTALNALGQVALYRGKLSEARRHFFASREFAERAQLPAMQLSLTNNLAIVAGMEGDFAEAHRQFRQAAALCEPSGDLRRMLALVMNGGVAAHYLPDLVEAKRLLTQACELARQVQDRENLALALSNLASVAIDAGELVDAQKYLDDALALIQPAGTAYVHSAILEEIARLELARGKFEPANTNALAALRTATEHRLVDPQLHALITLAAIRNHQSGDLALQILALVERAPSLTATARARLSPMLAALPGDALEKSRAWAATVDLTTWVNALLAKA